MHAHGDAMTDTDARSQAEKFKDLARELECDDDEEAFDERLKKLAAAPAPKSKPRNPE